MDVIRVSETVFLVKQYPDSIVMRYNVDKKTREFLAGNNEWEQASEDHEIEDLENNKELLLYYMGINARIIEDLNNNTFLGIECYEFFDKDGNFIFSRP